MFKLLDDGLCVFLILNKEIVVGKIGHFNDDLMDRSGD